MKEIKKSPIDEVSYIDMIADIFRSALAGVSIEYLGAQVAPLHVWLHQVDIKMLGLTSGHQDHTYIWVMRADALLRDIRDFECSIEREQFGNARAVLAALEAKKVAINATLATNGVL